MLGDAAMSINVQQPIPGDQVSTIISILLYYRACLATVDSLKIVASTHVY